MSKQKTPWKDGYYYAEVSKPFICHVKGEKAELLPLIHFDYPNDAKPRGPPGKWEFGDFGPAKKEVFEAASGKIKNYNVKMSMMGGIMQSNGIFCEEEDIIYSWGFWNSLTVNKLMSPEALQTLLDERDSFEAPSCPYYKIQPENQGKLVWLSGPPGAGKSTTGAILARNHDFVYYEADCAANYLNPFVDPNSENPTMAGMTQTPLKGVPREYVNGRVKSEGEFMKIAQGKADEINWELTKDFYTNMAKGIGNQQKRIGGNFVVAQAVTNRMIRDHIRKTIPNCIFITMSLSKDTQKARITKRHGEGHNVLVKIFDLYEGPGEDEENTFNVDITPEMTKEEVAQKVLDVLRENGK